MTGLLELSADDLLSLYASGEATPVEAVEQVAERTAAVDAQLGAFTTLCLERARSEARECEQAYRRGEPQGALAGLPLGVKDLFDSSGVRTTYGSPMCADHVPKADAEALRRARAAGAILVGKTQTHEWAWGISSVNELMGTSHNPWALDRISGGSSGGSAVALASHQVHARPRQRHRRIDPRALGTLWHRRLQADLRTSQYGRDLAARPHARPPGAHGALACGRGTSARRRSPAGTRPIPRPPTSRSATSRGALARGLEGSRRRGLPRHAPHAAHARRAGGLRRRGARRHRACGGARSRRCVFPEVERRLRRVRRYATGRSAAHAHARPGCTRRARRSTAPTCAAGSRPRRARASATTCAPPPSARACAPRSLGLSRKSS